MGIRDRKIGVRKFLAARSRNVTVTLKVTVTCLLAALLFTACGEVVTEPVDAVAIETITHTSTPTGFNSWPSWTPLPSATPTPTSTIDIVEQTRLAAWTATEQARQIAIEQYPINCDPSGIHNRLISPDAEWIASGCYGRENVFIVTNHDGSKYWYIPGGNKVGEIPGNGFCEGVPIRWSNDSRNVYFYLHYCYEPSIIQIHWYRIDQVPDVLYVMDAYTSLWYQLTPGANLFSFSPTGRRLLYISIDYRDNEPSSIRISILDLQTGETVAYSLTDYLVASHVVWSNDGTKAFLSAERGLPVYVSDDPHTYSIYVIDMLAQKITNIYTFPDSEMIIYTADYLDEKNILVLRSSTYSNEYEEFYLDLNTIQILEHLPSPTP